MFKLSALSLVLLAFILTRLLILSFPDFTTEEIRTVNRSVFLSQYGTDEFGRSYPLFFNAADDYQFPLVSYFSALIRVFLSDTSLSIRIGFVLINLVLVFLSYRVILKISEDKNLALISSVVLAFFSPLLIFISSLPLSSVILVCLTLLVIWSYLEDRWKVAALPLSVALLLSAKEGMLILPLVSTISYYLSPNKSKKLLTFSLILSLAAIFWWTQQPNGLRSLLENDLTLLSDLSLANGINTLRGQGLDHQVPTMISGLLINKLWVVPFGLIHYLQYFHPSFLFGNLDSYIQGYNFLHQSVFVKSLVVPFVIGILQIFKKWRKYRPMGLIPLVIITPAALSYPHFKLSYILLLTPFLSAVIAIGLNSLNKYLTSLIIVIAILEVSILFVSRPLPEASINQIRPGWFDTSSVNSEFPNHLRVSDDVLTDVIQRLVWIDINRGIKIVPEKTIEESFLYKYSQIKIGRYEAILSSEKLINCPEQITMLLSASDYHDVRLSEHQVIKEYADNRGRKRAYLIKGNLCINQ